MKTTHSLTTLLALALLGLVLLALSVPAARAAPTILRVTVSGATSGACGGTWEAACGLQHALNEVAVAGDELWVAAGTYTPTAGADRTATFHLRDGIALYGGFGMTETLRSQRSFTSNVTILSGDLNGDDNGNVEYDELTRAENVYHVVTGSGVTNNAVLDGFTVMGGNANASVVDATDRHSSGGGMYSDGGSPVVKNVTFINNTVSARGGGMYNFHYSNPVLTGVTFAGNSARDSGGGMDNYLASNPTLTNVIFSGNSADGGGGMDNDYFSSPTLASVTFRDNRGSYGGGMLNGNSSPTLKNATFIKNSAAVGGGMYSYYNSSPMLANVSFTSNSATWGGGMFNRESSPTLMNVTFSGNLAVDGGGMDNDYFSSPALASVTFFDNSAHWNGGGMSNDNFSSPTLTNITFISNTATTGGGGMSNENRSRPRLTHVTFANNSAHSGGGIFNDRSSPTIRNAIFWGNMPRDSQVSNVDSTIILENSVVQAGYPDGTNIMTVDPLLGSLGDWGGSTQTIPLLPGSPAIDAGDDDHCPPTDQRGIPRPQGAHCDIGAFEFQEPTGPKANGKN